MLKQEQDRLQVALDRKEYFLQSKERKWAACEDILEELCPEVGELRSCLSSIRLEVEGRE